MVDGRDLDELEAWLRKQPRDVSVVIAARAALRVVPLLEASLAEDHRDSMTPILRCAAAAWSAAAYADPEAAFAAAAAFAASASAASSAAAGAAAYSAASAARASTAVSAARASYAVSAARASSAASNAVSRDSAAAALSWDIEAIEKGDRASDLAGRGLWPNRPPEMMRAWLRLKAGLFKHHGEHWEVWIDWYEARLAGKPANKDLEIARVMIPDETWKQGPAVVNAEIKRLIEGFKKLELPVPRPELGPVMNVTSKGLEIEGQPLGENHDDRIQRGLHKTLQKLLPRLIGLTHQISNEHRELDAVVSEYGDLIKRPFEDLDVASLWAVGTGLLAFREAFALRSALAMTPPLEPAPLALLQQVAEIQSGFVLGFPLGRDLVERADKNRLSPELVTRIAVPAHGILDALRRAGGLVEKSTRDFLGSIDDATTVHCWNAARVGYAGYVVTRNSLIALGRVLINANSSLATLAGSVVMSEIDPGLEMTRHVMEFVMKNSQDILSFSEPFPELKIWFGSIIDHLYAEDNDKTKK